MPNSRSIPGAKAQPRDYGKMVAWKLPILRKRRDFSLFYLDAPPGQNPINPNAVGLNGFEIIEGGNAIAAAFFRRKPGIRQELVTRQNVVGFICLGRSVEIANEQHRKFGMEIGDSLADELGAFLASHLDFVIEMRVEKEELVARRAVAKFHPGNHSPIAITPGG